MTTQSIEGAMPPLPCPFCGCADVLIKRRKTTMVECKGCGVVVFDYQDGVQRNPVEVWNRRTTDAAPLLARVAELEEALKQAVIIIDGAVYRGHVLNTLGEEKLRNIRAALAAHKEQP